MKISWKQSETRLGMFFDSVVDSVVITKGIASNIFLLSWTSGRNKTYSREIELNSLDEMILKEEIIKFKKEANDFWEHQFKKEQNLKSLFWRLLINQKYIKQ